MNVKVTPYKINDLYDMPRSPASTQPSSPTSYRCLSTCFDNLESSILSFVDMNKHLSAQTEILRKLSIELQSIEADVTTSAKKQSGELPRRARKILKLKRTKSKSLMSKIFEREISTEIVICIDEAHKCVKITEHNNDKCLPSRL